MKKLLTLALSVVMLAAFTGLSVAEEKKPVEPAAIPPANKVTLQATQNMASKTGCPVTAWVGFVNTQGKKFPLKNYTVNFVKDSGSGAAPSPGTSDTKGEVKRNVPWNTTIHAEVPMGSSKPPLISNNSACGAGLDSAK